jgi:hypothetical protein
LLQERLRILVEKAEEKKETKQQEGWRGSHLTKFLVQVGCSGQGWGVVLCIVHLDVVVDKVGLPELGKLHGNVQRDGNQIVVKNDERDKGKSSSSSRFTLEPQVPGCVIVCGLYRLVFFFFSK